MHPENTDELTSLTNRGCETFMFCRYPMRLNVNLEHSSFQNVGQKQFAVSRPRGFRVLQQAQHFLSMENLGL